MINFIRIRNCWIREDGIVGIHPVLCSEETYYKLVASGLPADFGYLTSEEAEELLSRLTDGKVKFKQPQQPAS